MKKTLLVITLFTTFLSHAANKDLPKNFSDLDLFCSTWDNFKSDSKEQSLEKFSISKADQDGIRTVSFNNSKQDYSCYEDQDILVCGGFAYQVNDDQLLADTDDSQKFEVRVDLDLAKHRSDLIEGTGTVPSGIFGSDKTHNLYCEILGNRQY
jgi:hypothetical protein